MSRPLRILIAADTYPPDVNGAARFTERLAAGLAGRGHDVHVVAPSEAGPASSPGPGRRRPGGAPPAVLPRPRPAAVPVLDCPGMAVRRDGTGAARRSARTSCTCSRTSRSGAACSAPRRAPGTRPSRRTTSCRRTCSSTPACPDALAGRVSGWAWRDLARVYARRGRGDGPDTARRRAAHSRTGLPARAVSCGIDLARFGATGSPTPHPTVLFVGRLEREKKVDELIRAFALVPGRARLEIVGDGTRREGWTGAGPRPRPGLPGALPRHRGRRRARRGLPAVRRVLHARRRRAAEPGHAGGDGGRAPGGGGRRGRAAAPGPAGVQRPAVPARRRHRARRRAERRSLAIRRRGRGWARPAATWSRGTHSTGPWTRSRTSTQRYDVSRGRAVAGTRVTRADTPHRREQRLPLAAAGVAGTVGPRG